MNKTVSIYKSDFKDAEDGYGPGEDPSLFGYILTQLGILGNNQEEITEVELEVVDFTIWSDL